MNDKLNITTQTGSNLEASIICYLENTQSGKRYLYYTLNEIVGTGANSTVKIYVSKMRQNDPILDAQISDEEWNTLKNYMGEALKGIENSTVKYLPLSELSDPISVSDRVIAMPVNYDYINKHRGIYAQAVVTVEATPIVEVSPTVEPAPVQEPLITPSENVVSVAETTVQEPLIVEPTPINDMPVKEPVSSNIPNPNAGLNMIPIDLAEIEQKYNEMINSINKLKEQELEAAKRYNATLELSAMHNEQHANYVANEQIKEVVSAPVAQQVFEPTPITPIVPEPVSVPQSNPTDIETNWFDMPQAA